MIPLRAADFLAAAQRSLALGSVRSEPAHSDAVDRRGHRLPSTLEAIAARNRLLIVTADRHFAGMSDRAAAMALHTALARYQTGRWRRSRADLANPHPADTLAAALWAILKTRDHVPSTRTIRAVLARPS